MEINKQINIPYLLKIGNGKIEKIGKYLVDKGFNNVAIFYGAGIQEMLEKRLNPGLETHNINIIHSQIITDIAIEEITKAAFNLPANTDAIVAIGGGKALDFGKYAAHLLRLPFISVPTSLSNDGFCSPSSSLTVAGARKSVKSSIPFGVVLDLDIVKNSPEIFFYSGLGDMISKVTALYDWKKAADKKLSKYSDFAALMAYNSLDLLFIKHSSDISAPEFQRSLANSLLISGVAMEVAGTSRPASGSEHLLSHALDKVLPCPQMHGIQVGVSTILCALLQKNDHAKAVKDILQTTGFIDFAKKSPFDKNDFIKAIKLAPSIKNNYWTILSVEGNIKKAIKLLDSDDVLKELIK